MPAPAGITYKMNHSTYYYQRQGMLSTSRPGFLSLKTMFFLPLPCFFTWLVVPGLPILILYPFLNNTGLFHQGNHQFCQKLANRISEEM
jgi:hypothetical protein